MQFHPSNHEFEIIDWINEARVGGAGLVINPAALTHTSVAILHALNACEFPAFEVSISNVHKREEFRRHSYASRPADGMIATFGTQAYTPVMRAWRG